MSINSYPDNSDGEVNFPDQLIDPVSKFRVSNPQNLIDTDFEYGLQPTKWETVELINNTPSFFSKSGDTTIDGISSIITNAGTREIIVKTELDHGLDVGIPINVTGTKSITADGAYIINSIPDARTFTYLCKDNQPDTNSILDLYSSIITGEFFQGSQLRISDSEGIVTDAEGTSVLTVTTNTTHGFGENTPFYFLNLNSTVAQEFQAANTASKSFDASNSATAQTFDGSNSLSSVSIDWSNSATFGGTPSTVSGTDQAADRITVTHTAENFNNLPIGTPLYYSVSATGGYFNTNPRGVVFLKSGVLGTSTSTFQVSLVPDGNVIDLTSNLNGTFQIANQARTFAGNNIDPLTQTVIDVEVGTTYNFDGGNQGYVGEADDLSQSSNTLTVFNYSGTTISADGTSNVDGYVGAMVRYTSSGTAATGLSANTTYFMTSFTNNTGGNYTFSVAALPGGTPISISGGTGTQAFARIGVSVDKDIVHIPNSNFALDDMIEYTFPTDGRFDVVDPEEEKRFYFVEVVYDSHNYKISETFRFKPVVATGGTILPDVIDKGRTWKVHQFTSVGTTNFVVSDPGKEALVEYLIVAGGGSGGTRHGGGGGAGGMVTGSTTVTAQTYPVVVGAGGLGQVHANGGLPGGNSSVFSRIALGGGAGHGFPAVTPNGGSGGGASDASGGAAATPGTGLQPNSASGGFGNSGGTGQTNPWHGGGGGGAGATGDSTQLNYRSGNGGQGRLSTISGSTIWYAGGGGGSGWEGNPSNRAGFGGLGGGGNGAINRATPAAAPANLGGGGGAHGGDSTGSGGNGGSGIVIIRYPITPALDFVAPSATGGIEQTVTENGIIYKRHTFSTVGTSTFNVSSIGSWNNFEILVVGGGGGGGCWVGGGGGGGGVAYSAKYTMTTGSHTVVVGDRGLGLDNPNPIGQYMTNLIYYGSAYYNGKNSSISGPSFPTPVIGVGGGHGGSWVFSASSGGNGGGGSGAVAPGGSTQPNYTGFRTFGTSGGNGRGNGDNGYPTGGGGGAVMTGGDWSPTRSGSGGDGFLSTISGAATYFGSGGGGGVHGEGNGANAEGGYPGRGNGGPFGFVASGSRPQDAPANRGAGGAGNGRNGNAPSYGGHGGTGIVIIRYPIGIAT
jgi:hypothetical protein